MKRILVLGGGYLQVPLIKKAIDLGYEVVVSDYYEKIVGKDMANFGETISTFDVEGNIKIAKKYNVAGVLTCATDQPVLTAAKVAEHLNLPSLITEETALKLTNKKFMKEELFKHNIPTTNYKTIKNLKECKIYSKELGYPVVIKPVDSQGQRGVYLIKNESNLDEYFNKSKEFSRTNEVIVEKYYENEEISVQVWVKDYKPYILLVTDRVTTASDNNIGICLEHVFPSKHLEKCYNEVNDIITNICKGFDIKNGPIYIQFFIGKDGIKVGELGGRIGGANEYYTVKAVSGIDMCDLLLEQYFNDNIDIRQLEEFNVLSINRHAIMKWIFGKPGMIEFINKSNIATGFYQLELFVDKGREIDKLSGTQKLGYLLAVGESSNEVRKKIYKGYSSIEILDKNGNNLIDFINRDKYEEFI